MLTAVYFVLQDYHAEELLSAGLWIVALQHTTVLLTAVRSVLNNCHVPVCLYRRVTLWSSGDRKRLYDLCELSLCHYR
jgi:hypothetical protein